MRSFLYTCCLGSALSLVTSAAWAASQSTTPAPAPKSVLAEDLDKFSTANVPEATPGSLGYALIHGTPTIDMRYRYESVEQDGLAHDADASTLRTRLGYATGKYQGFLFGLSLENVTNIGAERYNNTDNGKTTYPIVLDPEDTLLDQLYLSYQGFAKTNITVGRQVIKLDNERFVGPVEWRQHHQVFDAASITIQPFDHASFYYAYVDRVNRVPGPDAPGGSFNSNSHLINASYEFDPALKLTGYGYLLDFGDTPTSSTATYGARATGKVGVTDSVNFIYAAEAAHQTDDADNTLSIDEDYYLLEPGFTAYGFTGKFGYEVLEGNGTTAFQTPLATLHAFNGWADKFLVTPANGLEDRYVSLSYKMPTGDAWIKGMDFVIAYHNFDSENTSADYGTEWDASISQTFADHYTVGLKVADYNADSLFTDTTKGWIWLTVKY